MRSKYDAIFESMDHKEAAEFTRGNPERIKFMREVKNNKKNIDSAISSYKPTIFWKEKEIVKQQVKMLNQNKTKDLILKANEVELLIKKNPQISINLTTDFIISQTI